MRTRGWRLRSDAGSGTAEFAVAMPAVLLVLALSLAAVVGASAQVRVQDAAGEAARLAARGDATGPGIALGGAEASASVWEQGELRCVTVDAPIRIAGLDLGVRAEASSCALRDTGK